MLNDITNLIVLSSLVPLGLFVYYYGRYSPWKLTGIGRTMMYKNLIFMSVIILVVLSLFFGDYPGREPLRFIVYSAMVFVFWMNFLNLRRVQVQHSIASTRFIDRIRRLYEKRKK